ncbi:MAG: hypothetical protein ABL973_00450 [Micropepsaceae bacterium]
MSHQIANALRGISKPIFAAAFAGPQTDARLIVHVAAVPQRDAVTAEISQKARAAGAAKVEVRFHDAASLNSPRSLERLLAVMDGEHVVYDPTGAITQAKSLLAAGRTIRASLAGRLDVLAYAPTLRTLFVKLHPSTLASGAKVRVSDLAGIESSVARHVADAFGPAAICPSIRIGFGLPAVPLVAIEDAKTENWLSRASRAVRLSIKPLTVATIFGLGTAAGVAADPAVNQTNLKITGLGGQVSGDGAWSGVAAVTLPVGQQWGIQGEFGGSGVDGDTSVGAAAHIFTRDPDSYLAGAFVAHVSEDQANLSATRIGAEAEIYLQQVTLLAKAGYQFSDNFEDTAFANVDVRWYATDNFAITAGGDFEKNVTVGRLQAEYMPGFAALPGLAFNIRGAISDEDYDSVMGGITYYFGTDAGLKDRHRRQDPDSALFGLFQTVEAERDALTALYGPPT